MKLLVLLFLLTPSLLQGAIWRSDALMRPLEEVDAAPEEGWWLEDDGDERRLYYGTELVRSVKGSGSLVTGVDGESHILIVDGRPFRETGGDGTVKEYFYSADGTLSSLRTVYPDGTVRTLVYDFSPLTGLSAVWQLDGDGIVLYSAGRLAWAEDGVWTSTDNAFSPEALDALSEGLAQRTEDGGTILSQETEEGTLRSLYSPDGLLTEQWLEDSAGSVLWKEEREYDSSHRLFFTTRSGGGERTDSYYVDGQLVQTVVFADAVVDCVRIMLPDGRSIARIYREGQPYAQVLYDLDGSRVLSLEML